jgi:Secretion system C-terminal sorting domain
MRKFILLILSGIGFSSIVFAQARDHFVIATQGGSGTSPTLSIDWTLGELATESVYTTNRMFTQGFHQPLIRVNELISHSNQITTRGSIAKAPEFTITVAPNPASSGLTVNVNGLDDQDVDVFITDGTGKRLLSETIAMGSGSAYLSIGDLATGLYILSCYTNDKRLLSVFKISKI